MSAWCRSQHARSRRQETDLSPSLGCPKQLPLPHPKIGGPVRFGGGGTAWAGSDSAPIAGPHWRFRRLLTSPSSIAGPHPRALLPAAAPLMRAHMAQHDWLKWDGGRMLRPQLEGRREAAWRMGALWREPLEGWTMEICPHFGDGVRYGGANGLGFMQNCKEKRIFVEGENRAILISFLFRSRPCVTSWTSGHHT
jgi:hypothetical protein